MMNYKKQKIVNVPEPKLEKDPRSNTVSNGAFNFIVKPEQVAVRGTKRQPALPKESRLIKSLYEIADQK